MVTAELDAGLGADGPGGPAAPIGVGAPGMVDRAGRLCFAPNLPQAHGVDWTALIGDRLPGRRRRDRERRQPRGAGGASAGRRPRLSPRADGHARHGHRRRHRRWTDRVQVGAAGFAGRDRAHGRGPGRTCLPLRPAGLLGAFRVRRRAWAVLAREAALAGKLDEVVRLAGGDPESVRGEDVSAAAAAGDPAAQRVIAKWAGGSASAWPTSPPSSTPSASCSAAALSRPASLLVESARAAFAELVEGGDGARSPWSSRLRSASGPAPSAAALAARQGGLVVMRTGVVLPTFRGRARRGVRGGGGGGGAGSTACSATTTSGPWASRSDRRMAPFPVLGALAARLAPRRTGTVRSWARSWRGSAWLPTTCWRRSSPRSRAWHPAGSSPGSGPVTT